MEQSNFYAMMSRMKYINRWGLMNNTKYENLSEHSLQVAMIAHCLVLIHNKKFGGNLNAERASILAIFHDTTEIIKDAYKEIENAAADRLCSLLPEDFRKDMEEIIKQSGKDDLKLKRFVKAADRFSALIKCIEELRMGNEEFREAKNGIEKSISDMNMPEADVFTNEFLPAFSLSLDEMQ